MIESFVSEETQRIFLGEISTKYPREMQRVARRKLLYLHNANDLFDLKSPPGNHLEKLKGDWQEYYSIRINDQWRICFMWNKGKAQNVEIVDYHD
ncbi:MAG: hypothetical protein FP831_15500 [Anaerolineae bacterium]|nr:hypothetical protein [Anaerolineae bacterium]